MKTKNVVKMTLFFSLITLATLAMSIPALAACNPGDTHQYRTSIVTYYEATQVLSAPFDSRRTLVQPNDGPAYWRIRLRGTLYRPCASVYATTAQFPAIIVNHGSGAEFEADTKHWQIADYFVPKGYIVFVPFRRGYGDDDPPAPNDPVQISDKSTGAYMDDMVADFISGNPIYPHPTNCAAGDGGCYQAELFEEEARVEIADNAMNYLKNRSDVKKDASGGSNIAIMGNSYGGAVTVLTNQFSAGQKAVVAFAAATQQWNPTTCAPNDPTCPFPVQNAVLSAARNAKKPTFYLQAKWDYDTRATIDLAYAHAYGGSDDQHGKRFMASIFPYQKPGIDPTTGQLDYQSVHTGFFSDPSRWGTEVLEFIRTYGVK